MIGRSFDAQQHLGVSLRTVRGIAQAQPQLIIDEAVDGDLGGCARLSTNGTVCVREARVLAAAPSTSTRQAMPHRPHNTHRVIRTTVSPFTLTSWSSLCFLADPADTVTKKPRLRGAFPVTYAGQRPALPQANGSCRTMVWSRSGPVETMLIGQPASSSSERR